MGGRGPGEDSLLEHGARASLLFPVFGLDEADAAAARQRGPRAEQGRDGRCRAVVLESVLQEDTAPRPSSSVCGPSFFLGVWAGL